MKVLAYATVIEEMLPIMPPDVDYERLDFGLHINPQSLKETLQNAINKSAEKTHTVLLGYGLCSQAVVGLQANNCTLVIPQVDDCIAIFLGSVAAYQEEHAKNPGTYYLTKGWIKVGDTPFYQLDKLLKQYGEKRAWRIMRQILKNYTRLALINTGQQDMENYRSHTQKLADQFGLAFQELPGSTALIHKMLYGPWDKDFVIVPPGKSVSFLDFRN
jgi:hypothetical protein